MSVYLVHCPSLGLCKVGYASNVSRRFSLLKTCTPAEIELVAVRDGGRPLEAAIHRALSADRHHGEWFKRSHNTKAVFMAVVEPDAALPTRAAEVVEAPIVSSADWLKAAISSSGISGAEVGRRVADVLGRRFDRVTVSKIINGRRVFQADEMIAVSAVCGVPVHSPSPDSAGFDVAADTRDMPSLGVSSLDCPAPASAASGALSEGSA